MISSLILTRWSCLLPACCIVPHDASVSWVHCSMRFLLHNKECWNVFARPAWLHEGHAVGFDGASLSFFFGISFEGGNFFPFRIIFMSIFKWNSILDLTSERLWHSYRELRLMTGARWLTDSRRTNTKIQVAWQITITKLPNYNLADFPLAEMLITTDGSFSFQYLTKQTAALREVNDSRLRVYEQLEISIAELEKHNTRMAEESAADKSKIKRWGQISGLRRLSRRAGHFRCFFNFFNNKKWFLLHFL